VALAADVGAGSTIGAHAMVVLAIASVLDGSIFGDHCSPLSDTTILSSTATGSDHMDHVRTQVPYAVLVMSAAVLLGYLPVTLGMPVWLGLAGGLVALVLALAFVARPIRRNRTYA
jgi:Na+/H+ antiporter NhaC